MPTTIEAARFVQEIRNGIEDADKKIVFDSAFFLLGRLVVHSRRKTGQLHLGYDNFASGNKGGSVMPGRASRHPKPNGDSIIRNIKKHRAGQNFTTRNLVPHAKVWEPIDKTVELAAAETRQAFG